MDNQSRSALPGTSETKAADTALAQPAGRAELTGADLERIIGGLNPQPLPPHEIGSITFVYGNRF